MAQLLRCSTLNCRVKSSIPYAVAKPVNAFEYLFFILFVLSSYFMFVLSLKKYVYNILVFWHNSGISVSKQKFTANFLFL